MKSLTLRRMALAIAVLCILISFSASAETITYDITGPALTGTQVDCGATPCSTLTISSVAGQTKQLDLSFNFSNLAPLGPNAYVIGAYIATNPNIQDLALLFSSNPLVQFTFNANGFTNSGLQVNINLDAPNAQGDRLLNGSTLALRVISDSVLYPNLFVDYSQGTGGFVHYGSLANGSSTKIPIREAPPSPVPEPSTAGYLAIGAGLIAFARFARFGA